MLCKPRPNSNEFKRVAIGYKNPLCHTRAKQAQPALYGGHKIIKENHIQAIVYNSKNTLEVAEITRKKINDKINDPECVTHKNLTKHVKRGLHHLRSLTGKGVLNRLRHVTSDNFEGIQKALTKEVKEMKDVFEELEAEVAQHAVVRKHYAIELKNLLITNDNLIAECLSQEVFCVATNSELNVARFTDMHVANTTAETRCLALEAELANLRETKNQDNQTELINHFSKLECQLDEQWFDLTKETLREALQITPVNRNQAFDAPPSINGLIDFVNQLGYPKEKDGHSDLIPSIRFTKLIIHHLQRMQRFHSRPDSPLYLSNEEHVLGYLKFSAKGTKREIFGMPIPGRLITANIRASPYYQEYQENVAKHKGFLAGETRSTQDLPAPRPAKPARKPQSTAQKAPPRPSIPSPVTSTQPAPISVPAKTQENKCKQVTRPTDKPAKAKRIKRSISRNTCQSKGSPKSVGASEAKEVPAEEPQVADEDANFQKAMEESMKDAYALPKGPLPPVVAHDLLSLQKHKKTSHADQYIFQRRVSEPIASSFHDGSQDEGQAGPDPNAQAEGQAGSNPDETSEGQVGSNPDETSEGHARPDPGNAEARVQSTLSPMVHAGSDREHMDIDQLYEGFTATIYPNVQEN
nr:E-beta-farnesene synthase [Tanacetum cinerariifolium]